MESDFDTLLNGQQFKKLYDKLSNIMTEKYGLHKIEIEILLCLKSGRYDTARDIAECKYFSKAHISHAIDHLTEGGYIRGMADPQDRRCIHLTLTREAKPVCEELAKLRKLITEIIYKDVSEADQLVMARVAKQIVVNINEELMKEITS